MQQTIILIIGGMLGSWITFLMQKYGIGAVVASSLVGLLGALAGYIFKISHLGPVVFVGSFVGMSGINIFSNVFIIISGGISGFLYGMTLNIFPGFGGRLGTIAFVSVIVLNYLIIFFKKSTNYFRNSLLK